jgi:acetylornithine deacetylase/succinyl-diaminopimelate desuccinylase-like protein
MSAGGPNDGAVPATEPDWEAFDRLVDARIDGWVAELVEFLAIASEGGDEAHLREAADWTAARLRDAGAAVDIVELPGVPPLVVGRWGTGRGP